MKLYFSSCSIKILTSFQEDTQSPGEVLSCFSIGKRILLRFNLNLLTQKGSCEHERLPLLTVTVFFVTLTLLSVSSWRKYVFVNFKIFSNIP